MAKEINTIGVLTSGGDAPGMNAAIRAVVALLTVMIATGHVSQLVIRMQKRKRADAGQNK